MTNQETKDLFNLAFCLMNSKSVKDPSFDFYTYFELKNTDYSIFIDYKFEAVSIDNYIVAMDKFKNVLRRVPSHAPSFALMGICKTQFANFNEAIEDGIDDLKVSIDIDQNFAFAYNYIGIAYLKLNNLIEAKENFKHAYKLNPKYSEAKLNLALTNIQLKAFDAAMLDLDEIIQTTPQFSPAYFHRGNLKKSLGDIEGSFIDFEMYDIL